MKISWLQSCLLVCAFFSACGFARAEELGSVSTTRKLVGANDKIVIEAFDGPEIPGATRYVSRAKTGGLELAQGMGEQIALYLLEIVREL